MALSNVIHANESSFEKIINSTTNPVLIDFFADWCGPCKTLSPILDKLSVDNKKQLIAKIDVDSNQNLAQKFAIRSVPTLLIFKNGKQVERIDGVISQTQLESKLISHI